MTRGISGIRLKTGNEQTKEDKMCRAVETRFWEKVKKSKSCWNWTAHRDQKGYGAFSFNRKSVRAHRVSWLIVNGNIPNNLCVLHSCDNRACVRPDHLFLGTYKSNNTDRARKFRSRSKLNIAKVHAIDRSLSLGVTQAEIATLFNVEQSTISDIATHTTWKWR